MFWNGGSRFFKIQIQAKVIYTLKCQTSGKLSPIFSIFVVNTITFGTCRHRMEKVRTGRHQFGNGRRWHFLLHTNQFAAKHSTSLQFEQMILTEELLLCLLHFKILFSHHTNRKKTCADKFAIYTLRLYLALFTVCMKKIIVYCSTLRLNLALRWIMIIQLFQPAFAYFLFG